MALVNYEILGNIGVLHINNPPVNALSQPLRSQLLAALALARNDASAALVLLCEGKTFIAGADIAEFAQPQEPSLPELIAALMNFDKPIVAAMHGTALGGGLEVALACHYRIALTNAKFGFPEVQLGLLPGSGGTQMTPRAAGVEFALELITGGAQVSATSALEAGLIDRVVESDLRGAALIYAGELLRQRAPVRRLRDVRIDAGKVDAGLFRSYRDRLAKRARGQTALQYAVDCIEDAVYLPYDDGLRRERERFVECRSSPQSAALRHLFFAERAAAKTAGGVGRPIVSVAVVGAGTMGAGIALCFADAGLPVLLLETETNALERGLSTVAKEYDAALKAGRISADLAHRRRALIKGSLDYADLRDCDLVVEAVFENLDVKKQVFAQLDRVCKPGAILATNTSYQDINQIASATHRPSDVVGLHFFSPAQRMKLLEVVRADETSDTVMTSAMALAKTIGKTPVPARVCYGFIGNRMLRQYIAQSQLCLLEGSTPETVDAAMQAWGMAMGPNAVSDLSGLDVSYRARQALAANGQRDTKTYRIADALVESGRLGRKTGAGYYRYDPQTGHRIADPEVLELIERESAAAGFVRRRIGTEEIQQRLICALINEGAKILSEGIAQRAGDIDVVYVNGYGFPAFRGGPMFYADSVGLPHIVAIMRAFRDRFDDACWEPAPLLVQLAQSDKTFAQWQRDQI